MSMSPQIGSAGDYITLKGQHFGDTQEDSYVEIGGNKLTQSSYAFWSDASIRIFERRMIEDNKRILKNRKSARRKDWDYARQGEYFITTHTNNFYPFFGRIEFG